MDLQLESDQIYLNDLNTEGFARMLNDPSQCYKFYWLEAILKLIAVSDEDLKFDQIINEMIYEAWYSVTRYHLRLGPTIKGKSENFLEHAVLTASKDPLLPQPATKEEILKAIDRQDRSISKDKKGLANYVPYRLLSSFLDNIKGNDKLWDQRGRLIAYINKFSESNNILYTIIDGRGLEKRVHVNKYWKELIMDNYPVIISWIQLKKIHFLQDRNPGVPGIIYKLSPENENSRKVIHARELWKIAAEAKQFPICDIYSGNVLDMQRFDLDHFIPWSYLANDELWDLTPMEGSLNSSKHNGLPEWNLYFNGFATQQYRLYKLIFSNGIIRKQFEKCRRDNVNTIWASESLYIEGNSAEQFKNIMERNMKPLYDSAHLQGYEYWKHSDKAQLGI